MGRPFCWACLRAKWALLRNVGKCMLFTGLMTMLWFMPRMTRGNVVVHKHGGSLQMGGIHPNTESAYCYFCLLFGNLKRGQAATGFATCPWPVAPGALAACAPGGSYVLPAAGLPRPVPVFVQGGLLHQVSVSMSGSSTVNAYVVPDVLFCSHG